MGLGAGLMFLVYSGNVLLMEDANRELARKMLAEEMAFLGMNKAGLAAKAEVDPKTLRSFFRGVRWPQADKRRAISVAVGWPPDEIDHIVANGKRSQGPRRPTEAIDEARARVVARYTEAMRLAEIVELDPRRLFRATDDFIGAAQALWSQALEVLNDMEEGGDGNVAGSTASIAADTDVSAADDELQAAAKRGEIEEPGEFNT